MTFATIVSSETVAATGMDWLVLVTDWNSVKLCMVGATTSNILPYMLILIILSSGSLDDTIIFLPVKSTGRDVSSTASSSRLEFGVKFSNTAKEDDGVPTPNLFCELDGLMTPAFVKVPSPFPSRRTVVWLVYVTAIKSMYPSLFMNALSRAL